MVKLHGAVFALCLVDIGMLFLFAGERVAVMNSTFLNATTPATNNVSTALPTTSTTAAITSATTIAASTMSSTLSHRSVTFQHTVISTMTNNVTLRPSLTTAVANNTSNLTSFAPQCDSFNVTLSDDIGLSVVFGIAFMLGIFFAFFGYRVFKATCFVQSFTLFAVFVHCVLLKTTSLSLAINGIISCGVGFILGSASSFLIPVGISSMSLAQAVFLAGSTLTVVDLFQLIDSFWIPIGMTGGMFILLVALGFTYQRPVMIIYITSFSATLIMTSVDFYINKFLLTLHMYHKFQAHINSLPCWFSYLPFVLWPVVMLLGCTVQFARTAKGFHHKGDRSPSLKKKKSPSLHRGLYYNGDIIAQAWIQDAEDTLEKRCSYMQPSEDCYPEPGESTTLV